MRIRDAEQQCGPGTQNGMRTEETDQGKSANQDDEPAERGVPGGQQGGLAEQDDGLGEQGVSEREPMMLTREDDD